MKRSMNSNGNNLQAVDYEPFPMNERQWAAAMDILLGSATKMSVYAAATAAGVSRSVLLKCIERSRERRAGDPPWAQSMHMIYDERECVIADKLEDEIWKRGMGWTEKVMKVGDDGKVSEIEVTYPGDSRLLVRMMEVLDPRYRKTQSKSAGIDTDNPEEIRRKIQAEIHRYKLEQQDPTLKKHRGD